MLITASGFRPLSRGPFFNERESSLSQVLESGFRPLSWGSFFNSITIILCSCLLVCFRPLSRGPFFKMSMFSAAKKALMLVFVPFLGDLFSKRCGNEKSVYAVLCFRPLSRRPFFKFWASYGNCAWGRTRFSSPFSGTFFQIDIFILCIKMIISFRPLSRGPFFKWSKKHVIWLSVTSFRPLSRGPFFKM